MGIRIHASVPASLLLLLVAGIAAGQTDKSAAMQVSGSGCGCNCDLPTLWRSAEAVAFLRIQKALGTRMESLDGREFRLVEYRASVHEAFRRFFGQPKSIVDLLERRDPAAPDDPGYAPGQEFVAFMRWSNERQMFEPFIMIPVRAGQVKSPCIRELESAMSLESFLKILRAMME